MTESDDSNISLYEVHSHPSQSMLSTSIVCPTWPSSTNVACKWVSYYAYPNPWGLGKNGKRDDISKRSYNIARGELETIVGSNERLLVFFTFVDLSEWKCHGTTLTLGGLNVMYEYWFLGGTSIISPYQSNQQHNAIWTIHNHWSRRHCRRNSVKHGSAWGARNN